MRFRKLKSSWSRIQARDMQSNKKDVYRNMSRKKEKRKKKRKEK